MGRQFKPGQLQTGSLYNISSSFALTASFALNGGGSFPFSGSAVITGSLYVSGSGITGSLLGTASYATNALSASYINLAQTASYVLNAVSSSFASTTTSASFATNSNNSISSSYALSASYAPFVATNTGSLLITASISNANITFTKGDSTTFGITVDNVASASYAQTASYAPAYLPLTGGTVNGNVTINGTASIAFLNVTYESASVIYSSGSNQFGDATNDIQTLIGTVLVSGSQQITGSLNVTGGITGSLQGAASDATGISSSITNNTNNNILTATGTGVINGEYNLTFDSQTLTLTNGILTFTGSEAGIGRIQQSPGGAANGSYSHAQGLAVSANGNYSHAEGSSTNASGFGSHAEGSGSFTSTTKLYGVKANTITSGVFQLAGDVTAVFAPGNRLYYNSAANPDNTSFVVDTSVFGGVNTTITLTNTSITDSNFSVGSLDYPFTSWAGNLQSVSDGGHAEGYYTTAVADWSHAEGDQTQTFARYAHAEGSRTQANGTYSHAEGRSAKTFGQYSHAEGRETQAKGDGSHAEGYLTISSGSYSHAEGYSTTSTGDYSHAEGLNTISSGSYSHAEGRSTTAIGEYSHAEGESTTAAGAYSHAEGLNTISSGSYSHAEGSGTTATGVASHAEGESTTSTGGSSHAEGSGTTATGVASHAEGSGTTSTGEASHAEGASNQAIGDASHAEGYTTTAGQLGYGSETSITSGVFELSSGYGNLTSLFSPGVFVLIDDYTGEINGTPNIFKLEVSSSTYTGTPATQITLVDTSINTSTNKYAIGIYGDFTPPLANVPIGNVSHTSGESTHTVGLGSSTEGSNTEALGYYSHAEGSSTTATGYASHAEGESTTAAGAYSHAEGSGTISSGDYSHAEGRQTTATGIASHAEGRQTTATGDYSHAEGLYTVASGSYQHVQGQFNLSSSAQSAFIIGNGTADNARSNLIFASGSQVEITGSVIATSGFTGSLLGTASYATQALSASYAITASYATNALSASYAPTIGPNLGRILFVSTTGNNSTAQIGDISKTYLTIESAVSASTSGDVVHIFQGTYTLTTTASAGIAKDGINYYFEPGCTINKATSGSIFNITGFTTGFNVFGYGTFNKTSTVGTILTSVTNAFDFSFEALDISSTIDKCFSLSLNAKTATFKFRHAISSAATVFTFPGIYTNADNYDITATSIISTSTNAIITTTGVGRINLKADLVKSTTAVAISQIYYTIANFNINYCLGVTYGYTITAGSAVTITGYTTGINNTSTFGVTFNGTAGNLLNTGTFSGGSITSPTINGGQATFTWFGDYFNTLTVTAGIAYVTAAHNNSYTAPVNVTGGKLYLTGNITGGNFSYDTFTINGSTAELIFNGKYMFASGKYQSPVYAFNLINGTLRLTGNIENKITNSSLATCVLYQSGSLILDGVSLITANSNVPPIIVSTGARNLRTYSGGMSTNRTENGGTYAAKTKKYKYTVTAVASTSITLNDGSGGNEVFTEANTATYNTTALLAQRMAVLINASATLDITATQDTPGTDIYFYTTADVAGIPFTTPAYTNLTELGIRENSYLMTELVGGTIIENSNII